MALGGEGAGWTLASTSPSNDRAVVGGQRGGKKQTEVTESAITFPGVFSIRLKMSLMQVAAKLYLRFFSLIAPMFNSEAGLHPHLTAEDLVLYVREATKTNKRWENIRKGKKSWLCATSGLKTLLIHSGTKSIKAE